MGRRISAGVAAAIVVLMAASSPANGGIVFREIETVESGDPPRTTREVRQVFADGDSCKIVLEESADPLIPAGSYVLLAAGGEAFIVDPGTRSMAPLEPATMKPVESSSAPAGASAGMRVTVDLQLDEPGPPLLGLATRHYVYRLAYEQTSDGSARSLTRPEERHEVWATPVPPGERPPEAWQMLRAADDAGRGPVWREAREAIGQIQRHGLVLRQIIERRGPEKERVVREITALSRGSISPELFRKPAGFSQSEFLAPPPGANGRDERGASSIAPQ
jgi:hypothetical protein